MTFRIREAHQRALAQSHVGHFLADLARPVAKVAYFDALQHCVRVTGHREQETRIELDEEGNVASLITPLGRRTSYAYEQGRQIGARLPTGLTIRTRYESAGRVAATEDNDGTRHEFAYDTQGNLTALRSGDGAILQLTYGAHGQVERVRERDGSEIRRAYDDRGRLTKVVDPQGRATRFAYGLWTEPDRVQTPDGHVLSYVYRCHEAQERIDGVERAQYTFDERNRLTQAAYADGYTLALTYDDHGRLTSALSPHATVQYEYDRAGRVIAESQDERTLRYGYDEDGQLCRITLPDGRSTRYSYDLDGRVSAVHDPSGGVQRFRYGAAERPLHRELPNTLVESYQLDRAGRITAIELHDRRQVFWSQRYARDAVGRVSEQSDSRLGERVFRYDSRSRLREVSDPASGASLEQFSYDATSQRLHSTQGVALFDAMCRPLQGGRAHYRYDALGNRTEEVAEHTTRFAWTGPNLLCEVALPDGALARYFYDALGRRIRKQLGDTTVTYVWAAHQLIQELHECPDGAHTVDYVYLPGTHQLLAKIEDGAPYYYHCDQLGTPQFLTDGGARLVWSARYEAYGQAQVEHHFVAQPWRFLGHYWDAESGLHYNRARYYDPALGVYLSRDPLAPIGENAYIYAGANPINVADPLGLFWEDAPGWVKTAATIGAGIAVGVAVGAAVIAAAPALGIAAGSAGLVALLAGGALGGAAAGGFDAAMTKGGCVACGMLKGGVVGLLAALPFAFLPATAGLAAFAGMGMVSGAVGYFANLGLSGGQFSWGALATAVAFGGVLGAAGKYLAGRFGEGGGPGGVPEDPPKLRSEVWEDTPASEPAGVEQPVEEPASTAEQTPASEPAPELEGERLYPRPDLADRPDEAVLSEHYDALDAHEGKYQKRVDCFDAFDGPAQQRGGNQAKVTEALGERALTDHMLQSEPGAEMVKGFEPGPGVDQVWVKRDPDGNVSEYIIGEAKGPGQGLKPTETKGNQMSQEWVERSIKDMARSKDPDTRALGRDLQTALRDGDPPVTGRAVQSDGQGGSNLLPIDGTTTPCYN